MTDTEPRPEEEPRQPGPAEPDEEPTPPGYTPPEGPDDDGDENDQPSEPTA